MWSLLFHFCEKSITQIYGHSAHPQCLFLSLCPILQNRQNIVTTLLCFLVNSVPHPKGVRQGLCPTTGSNVHVSHLSKHSAHYSVNNTPPGLPNHISLCSASLTQKDLFINSSKLQSYGYEMHMHSSSSVSLRPTVTVSIENVFRIALHKIR